MHLSLLTVIVTSLVRLLLGRLLLASVFIWIDYGHWVA